MKMGSNAPHYFPFHIGDYLRDTRGLSLLEHGAYLMLMLQYYASAQPLSADLSQLYRLTNARTHSERAAVRLCVSRFFQNGNAELTHKRISRELEIWATRSVKAKAAAGRKWSKSSKDKGLDDVEAMPTHSERNAQTMPTHSERNAQTMRTLCQPEPEPKPEPKPVLAGSRLSSLSNKNSNHTFAHSHSRSATEFAAFWEKYPRKKSKGKAMEAWEKLRPSIELAQRIVDAVETAKQSADWSKGVKFIPYPATWLQARGWEDEHRPASDEGSKTKRGVAAIERMRRRGSSNL